MRAATPAFVASTETCLCQWSGVPMMMASMSLLLFAEFMRMVNASMVTAQNMPVSRFWELVYLPYCEEIAQMTGKARKKPSTVRGYKQIWNQHLASHFGKLTLQEYEFADARAGEGICSLYWMTTTLKGKRDGALLRLLVLVLVLVGYGLQRDKLARVRHRDHALAPTLPECRGGNQTASATTGVHPVTTRSFTLALRRRREAFLNPRLPERCLAGDGPGHLIAVEVEV